MKFKALIVIVIAFFGVQVCGNVLFFSLSKVTKQDTVEINDILQHCVKQWGSLNSSTEKFALDYSVIDNEGHLLFFTKENLSQSVNTAIQNRDIILDVEVNGVLVGKLFVSNNYQSAFDEKKTQILIFNIGMLILLAGALIGYVIYIHKRVVKPFNDLHDFAAYVSNGNLDYQLNMDRQNIFGAFSESFDIMRTQLKHAREAEQKANESKKQLIANLSHDIKTPIASIKALAELGECKAKPSERDRYSTIVQKADQVNALVSNLFSATLEEMNELCVRTCDYESVIIKDMIVASDYLHKVKLKDVPEMLLCFDRQRLQQVFDNIVSNSYKYADTAIEVDFDLKGEYLRVGIKDFGGLDEEGKKLTQKYYRGKNAVGKDGSGLGLYISDYLMQAMKGKIEIQCNKDYFLATIYILIS